MTRPVVFSASSLTAYQSCHLQWWFGYVLVAEGVPSEPQATGILAHEYQEQRLKGMEPWRSDGRPGWTSVKPIIDVIDQDILPTYRQPVLIEASFQLEIDDIPFSGILDAVDRQDVPWGTADILRDLKTTGSRPSPGRYRLAMTGYWLGATDLLGKPPDSAQLDYIVRTKTPYYWPEVLEPITADDVARFAAVLREVARGVDQGDFAPTGLGTRACGSCNYREICGPYQRYQEVTNA